MIDINEIEKRVRLLINKMPHNTPFVVINLDGGLRKAPVQREEFETWVTSFNSNILWAWPPKRTGCNVQVVMHYANQVWRQLHVNQ